LKVLSLFNYSFIWWRERERARERDRVLEILGKRNRKSESRTD